MRCSALIVLSSLALSACRSKAEAAIEDTAPAETDTPTDADGDGFDSVVDCDDSTAAVYPGADELCDGVDNDCDATADEDTAIDAPDWYVDADGDGYGGAAESIAACDAPAGYIADSSDCDDASAAIHPGAGEVCDGLDNDCDGDADEDAADAAVWYLDSDGDAYGDAALPSEPACEAPDGHVADGADCDDADADTYPGAPEICADGGANDCDASPADAAAGCPLLGSIGVSDSYATYLGEDAQDLAGTAISGAGDFDGDGLDDLLIGAHASNAGGSYSGVAYVVTGAEPGLYDLAASDARLVGEDPGEAAGYSLGGAGDTDGDGLDDVIIGAYADSVGGSYAGSAYLVLGGAAGLLDLGTADARIVGEDNDDRAGWSVSGAGDADGDGLADLLIGAPGEASAATGAGAAYLVLGPVTGTFDLADARAKLLGQGFADYAATRVAGAGDTDGDGLDDLLIGTLYADYGGQDAGVAYLVRGGVSGVLGLESADAALLGAGALHYAAEGLAGAGDTDGDGYADVLVGAAGDSAGGVYAGAAYLVRGPISGTITLADADAKLIGEDAEDFAGESVAGAGDTDGDGLDDVLVGAVGDDDAGSIAGAAYLVLGGFSGTLDLSAADAKITGRNGGDRTGAAVSGAGDVDGDGLDDILIGAPTEHSAGADAGAAYLLGPRL